MRLARSPFLQRDGFSCLSVMEWGTKMLKIKLTKTHLSHSTLNAGAFEKTFGEFLNVNFADIPQGGKHGVEFKCILELGKHATTTTLKLYRPKSKKEKRMWISGLKEKASAGDYLLFFKGDKEAIPVVVCIETKE